MDLVIPLVGAVQGVAIDRAMRLRDPRTDLQTSAVGALSVCVRVRVCMEDVCVVDEGLRCLL